MNQLFHLGVLTLILMASTLPVFSQDTLTIQDYARAEKFLAAYTSKFVINNNIQPNWIDGEEFWFRKQVKDGYEFIRVNAQTQEAEPAFDHTEVAAGLSQFLGGSFSAHQLPFTKISYSPNNDSIFFEIQKQGYMCSVSGKGCHVSDPYPFQDPNGIESPDGKKTAFIREYNLWMRDLKTGAETQLTFDGIQHFGYATNNAGWTKSPKPVLMWSPDSRMIATFQHDERGVGDMYMVSTKVGHPTLYQWKYPLPEDSVIFRIHRVIIHVDEPRVVRLQDGPDPHRSSIIDHVALRGGGISDVEWAQDGSQLAFATVSRDHKEITLKVADPRTGEVRKVMGEKVDTFFESGYRKVNWHVLKESNEVIWFSQRYDWGHLYLYDLTTGKLKHAITAGNWNVLQVLNIDEENRTIYFTGAGKEEGDPYYQYLYAADMDQPSPGQLSEIQPQSVQLLTQGTANHTVSLSPGGKYFVDQASTPQTPGKAVLRSFSGKELMTLSETHISALEEMGWQPPESFSVKARDGETDLYGLMFKPTNFDPTQKYPIINYIYPGPQSGSIRTRSFAAARGDKQALAELGFIVVAIDAMGTPMRSKSFHSAYYGNMGDNGLPDQIAGMKQLAARYPWIDIDRVGIYGHSGGGFASTAAMLRYPDFFKVAVSGAGNHDNRNYEDDWGEKWQGLLTTNPDGSTSYDNQANHLLAKNLKGKLLLAHGTLDSNVPVSNTMLVVDALIEANKDFDLLLFPNRGHGFSNEAYMMRRRWDYFVTHLRGAEPPKEYQFQVNTKRR